MDAELLTSDAFWRDPKPVAAGDFPGEIPACKALAGHVLFETSGSSGAPKWIALSKKALRVSAAAVNRHLEVTRDSCWGLALPMRHVGGFGVAARAHEEGCCLAVFNGRWEPRIYQKWLEDHQVTHTSLVPTQVHDLAAAGLRAPACLHAVVVGGGHLDVATGRAARALGWPVLASYGMTEAGSQIATQELASLTSAYEPAPLPLLPVWQAQTDDNGRLFIAGEALFAGTLVKQDGAWVFEKLPSAWHRTGDRVLLEHGMLTPLGRADSLVKVLGELVDPLEIERELLALAEGALVPGGFIVAAIPDARAGHALVPVFEASATAADAILALYNARASGPRRLQPAVRLRSFPRSPLGKPLRQKISAMLAESSGNPHHFPP
jgi:O-succinylbenzoic acid--CoA ligase